MTKTNQGENDRLVCLCYKLTEKDIVDAIRGGADTMQKLAETTRLAERCEGCVMDGLELLSMHAEGFDWESRDQLHIRKRFAYHNKWANLGATLLPKAIFNKIIGSLNIGHYMSHIWLDGPDVATRIFVSNHGSPYFPEQRGRRRIRTTIMDADGATLDERETMIADGATELVDVRERIGRQGDRLVWGGVDIKIMPTEEVPYIFHGSLRSYGQWYNEHSITQVHEQFARNEYGSYDRDHHGYATFPEVLTGDWTTHMAIHNNRQESHVGAWVLRSDDGTTRRAPFTLAGRQTMVATPQEIFGEEVIADALTKGAAVVYLDRSVALTHYYLNQNVKEGIWQAQHL